MAVEGERQTHDPMFEVPGSRLRELTKNIKAAEAEAARYREALEKIRDEYPAHGEGPGKDAAEALAGSVEPVLWRKGTEMVGTIKMRVVIGKYEDDMVPVIVGAMDHGTYEVIDPDEWDERARAWKEAFDPMGQIGYEWREITVSLPARPLMNLFAVMHLEGDVEDA